MTVAQLASVLTQEELITWAAYYEIKHEEHDKAADRAKQQNKTMSARNR
jgi:hypothetical protein